MIGAVLGGDVRVLPIPIPLLCRDGFNEAYYGRPERLLDAAARQACSAWSFVSDDIARAYVDNLREDLDAGEWDRKYGQSRTQPELDGSLRLLISVR